MGFIATVSRASRSSGIVGSPIGSSLGSRTKRATAAVSMQFGREAEAQICHDELQLPFTRRQSLVGVLQRDSMAENTSSSAIQPSFCWGGRIGMRRGLPLSPRYVVSNVGFMMQSISSPQCDW